MKTPPVMSFLGGGTKALALVLGGFITSAMFVAIPLTQIVSENNFTEDVRTISLYKAPPPPPEIEPYKKEEKTEEKEENLTMKKEVQKLSLSTINMALNVGSGGTGASIYVGSFEIDDTELNLNIAFEISDLDKAPIPILQIAPVYPSPMKRANIRGKVIAEFIVTKNGRVVRIDIVESSHHEFERPVMEALRRWQFEPGIKDDQAVNTRVRIPFNFTLDSA